MGVKQELVQLAEKYVPGVTKLDGPWLISEKVDGQRFIWDGGVTRGLDLSQVPWAVRSAVGKIDPRIEARFADPPRLFNSILGHKSGTATGLWTRYGRPIYAPLWWLDKLPAGVLLDGELWCGRGRFQRVSAVVRRTVNGMEEGWHEVTAVPFEKLSWNGFLSPRTVDLRGTERKIGKSKCGFATRDGYMGFEGYSKMNTLDKFDDLGLAWELVESGHGPRIEDLMSRVLSLGGEGLMMRRWASYWSPMRTCDLLKYKPFEEDEASVVGTTEGLNRLDGMIGALVVSWKGKRFKVGSGLEDVDRNMLPSDWIGKVIKFRYRELTDGGIPKDPRYVGERESED
jgi:DNA ligase-1